MREIKFRAWDVRERKMYFGDMGKYNSIAPFCNAPDKYMLMQYTGLKDKNGKEIYEGDIVKHKEDLSCATVVWDEDYTGFTPFIYGLDGEYGEDAGPEWYEVIGDIYENPELLKEA